LLRVGRKANSGSQSHNPRVVDQRPRGRGSRSGKEEGESSVPEVVDGGWGTGEDGVEQADGLGPVATAAEARQLPAVGAHGGGDRSPEAVVVGKRADERISFEN
jgi:hypothetical protein